MICVCAHRRLMIARLFFTTISYQYASATLVYDPRLLSADPELKGFVNDRAADHPALKLKVHIKPADAGLFVRWRYVRVLVYSLLWRSLLYPRRSFSRLRALPVSRPDCR